MPERAFPQIVTMNDLDALGRQYRVAGKTVVSTNGCFDLLHAGHIRMLQQAKALGDVLVVGLNDDQSVRQLKGPSRPLVGQDNRALLLSALRSVDHVVVFSGLLPNEMLERLRPSIHCKAADYSAQSLPEAAIVQAGGGRVHILPFQDGYGTTSLMQQASRAAQNTSVLASPATESTEGSALANLLADTQANRQLAYTLAQNIEQAAAAISRAGKNNTVWIVADGRAGSGGMLQGLCAGRRTPRWIMCEINKASEFSGVAGDVLLVLCDSNLSAEIQRLLDQAKAKDVQGILIAPKSETSNAPDGVIHLELSAGDPLMQTQFQLLLLHSLAPRI